MLNPQSVAREALAAECTSFIDRLLGAPVRIVRNAQTAAPKTEKPAPVKAKAKSKPAEPQQLDIEDLFAVR